MVQSIFDDKEEETSRKRSKAPAQTESLGLGLADSAPPRPDPADTLANEAPPLAENDAPPPTQLDGTQRIDPYMDPVPNVYSEPYHGSESDGEDVRRSGLAWSAGVVFFGSVAFMLFIGWGADLLFGSSPWGLVLGIVFGSVIGFIQFFRISSQIYQTKPSDPKISPLMSSPEEDDDKDW